ncbi:STYK1 [Branchiostoma lanceolatum]|uniref:STYK1 protein n=1 Tax=Branchiostoma lanceolatum TaxID=7740 RepID=A0A8J9Z241_BRALA|nr:STYK1 [Branchiostoma lanceolatum]
MVTTTATQTTTTGHNDSPNDYNDATSDYHAWYSSLTSSHHTDRNNYTDYNPDYHTGHNDSPNDYNDATLDYHAWYSSLTSSHHTDRNNHTYSNSDYNSGYNKTNCNHPSDYQANTSYTGHTSDTGHNDNPSHYGDTNPDYTSDTGHNDNPSHYGDTNPDYTRYNDNCNNYTVGNPTNARFYTNTNTNPNNPTNARFYTNPNTDSDTWNSNNPGNYNCTNHSFRRHNNDRRDNNSATRYNDNSSNSYTDNNSVTWYDTNPSHDDHTDTNSDTWNSNNPSHDNCTDTNFHWHNYNYRGWIDNNSSDRYYFYDELIMRRIGNLVFGNEEYRGRVNLIGESSLLLNGTGPADAGNYTFTASFSDVSEHEAERQLIVHYPPKAPQIEATPGPTVTEGDTVVLRATADCFPPATYTWGRLDGSLPTAARVNATLGTLTISGVTMEDSGVYTVVAENYLGNSSARNVTIEVGPRPFFVAAIPSIGATLVTTGPHITPPPVNPPTSTGSQMTPLEIALIALGSTLVLAILLVGGLRCWWGKKKRARVERQKGPWYFHPFIKDRVYPLEQVPPPVPTRPQFLKYEVDRHHLELREQIGRGAFGVVHLATLRRTPGGLPADRTVVVKTVRGKPQCNEPFLACPSPLGESAVLDQGALTDHADSPIKSLCMSLLVYIRDLIGGPWKSLYIQQGDGASVEEKATFVREIETTINLGQHQNLLGLVGCCTLSNPPYLVAEYMAYGDLKKFLLKCRQPLANVLNSVYDMTELKMYQIGRQIANGMIFISEAGYVHGDLAARNILVGEDLMVKIADFGLATDVYERGYQRQDAEQKIPVRWMAPERLLREGRYTSKSDVWSFGVVLYEIAALGDVPYPSLGSTLLEELRRGHREHRPQGCPWELYNLMLSCWQWDEISRPGFQQLHLELDRLVEKNADVSYLKLSSASSDDEKSSGIFTDSLASSKESLEAPSTSGTSHVSEDLKENRAETSQPSVEDVRRSNEAEDVTIGQGDDSSKDRDQVRTNTRKSPRRNKWLKEGHDNSDSCAAEIQFVDPRRSGRSSRSTDRAKIGTDPYVYYKVPPKNSHKKQWQGSGKVIGEEQIEVLDFDSDIIESEALVF